MDEKSLKSKIFSGVLWRFGERICAQLVSFLISVILARLIAPEEYGTVAILLVFIEIANVFVTNGFGSALVQKKDVDEIDFSTVLWFNVFFSMTVYLLLFLGAGFIADFYSNDKLEWMLRVISVKIPLAAVNSIQQAYVQRKMIFRKFFFSTIIGTLLSGVVGVVMAFSGFGPWALIAQYLTNSIVDTIILGCTIEWKPKLVFSIKRLPKLFDFGWKILVASLLHTAYNNLQSLVIGKKYTTSDLAYYNQGVKLPQLLVVNVNSAITTVLFPAMSIKQNDTFMLKKILRKTIRIISIVMWPSMLGMLVLSEKIVIFLFSDKWISCVPFMQLSCIQFALGPITMAHLQTIKAIGRSDMTLKMEVIKRGFGMLALIFSMRYSVSAIAVAALIQAFFALVVNLYPNRIYLNYSFREQIADTCPSMVIAIIMALIVYVLDCNICLQKSIVELMLLVVIGVGVYVGMSFILNRSGMEGICKYVMMCIRR